MDIPNDLSGMDDSSELNRRRNIHNLIGNLTFIPGDEVIAFVWVLQVVAPNGNSTATAYSRLQEAWQAYMGRIAEIEHFKLDTQLLLSTAIVTDGMMMSRPMPTYPVAMYPEPK